MIKQKILVIDDHRMIIDGIVGLLQQDYDVTTVVSADQLHAILDQAQAQFDLALLDLNLGDGSVSLELLTKLKSLGIRVIIMSGTATDSVLSACIQHGALGFIDKHLGSQEVLPAVRGVFTGHMAFPSGLLSKLLNNHTNEIPKISDREKDVLNMLFLYPGVTNEVIGDTLSRSTGRIRNIATALFQKFNALDRHELVAKAQKLNYYPSQLAQRELMALKANQEQRALKAAAQVASATTAICSISISNQFSNHIAA
jgi:two-component system, NarL family, response regulator EvgA